MKTSWLFALITCLQASASAAAPLCTPQTTRGYWVYTCEGELPLPEVTPVRLLGTCKATRDAYWTCEGSINLGGNVVPQQLQGQANNEANCTGKITYANTVGGNGDVGY